MIQTVEAVVDATGRVRLLGDLRVDGAPPGFGDCARRAGRHSRRGGVARRAGLGGRLVEAGGGCGVVAPSAGEVVLVPFPFSDLSQSKLRPAVCLADAGRGDWVLCQITSSPYGDPWAVPLGRSGLCDRRVAGRELRPTGQALHRQRRPHGEVCRHPLS